MSIPQYRIPVERLKQDWEFLKRMERLSKSRPPQAPSRITDNSEPWINHPPTVEELIATARKINQTVAKWSPPQEHSSPH